ncbi:MAG: glycosyltransferase family 4 protein [Planctomycetes bacterium]|nr:glycosyltransferase family 4 protein [Planctomycetota bacterium]
MIIGFIGGEALQPVPDPITEDSLKVLVVSTSYPRFAGDRAGGFVASSCEALVKLGHEVKVVCPHAPDLAFSEVMNGVTVKRFAYGFGGAWECVAYGDGIPVNIKKSWAAMMMVPSFCRSLRNAVMREAEGCRIIHANWSVCGALSVAAARHHKIPLVTTMRGSDINAADFVSRFIARRACSNSDTVVTVSRESFDKALSSGANPERSCVITNGVDTEIFSPSSDKHGMRRKLGIDPEAIYLIAVGRLVSVKNIEYLIEAFYRLVHVVGANLSLFADNEAFKQVFGAYAGGQGMNDKATSFADSLAHNIGRTRLLLVGDGAERESLERMVNEKNLADRVSFVGEVNRDDVPDWLKASDIFALTSRNEGRPNSLIEAMACGLPPVCTPVGGVNDVIRDRENGILAELDKPDELAGILAHLVNNDLERTRIGKAALETILHGDFGWDSHARKLTELYKTLLEKKA